MRKSYEAPEFELVIIDSEDIVTTSPIPEEDEDEGLDFGDLF